VLVGGRKRKVIGGVGGEMMFIHATALIVSVG